MEAKAKAASSQQHADELEIALKRAQLLAGVCVCVCVCVRACVSCVCAFFEFIVHRFTGMCMYVSMRACMHV